MWNAHFFSPLGWCWMDWETQRSGIVAPCQSSKATDLSDPHAHTHYAGHTWCTKTQCSTIQNKPFWIWGCFQIGTYFPSRTHQPQYGSWANKQDWQSKCFSHSATGLFSSCVSKVKKKKSKNNVKLKQQKNIYIHVLTYYLISYFWSEKQHTFMSFKLLIRTFVFISNLIWSVNTIICLCNETVGMFNIKFFN